MDKPPSEGTPQDAYPEHTQPPAPAEGAAPPPLEGGFVPPPPYLIQGQPPPYPSPATSPQQSKRTFNRSMGIAWGLGLLAVVLATGAFAVGGEPARFMQVGIQFIPLAILAALAYGGVKNSTARIFTYIWLAIVALGLFANALTSEVLAFLKAGVHLNNPSAVGAFSDIFEPGIVPATLLTLLLLSATAIIAMLVLWRPVRVFLARFMPIDPDNFVHMIALSILTLVTLSSFVPLLVLGGSPPLLQFVKGGGAQSMAGDVGISIRPQDLIYQFVWTIPATFVAGGWPVVRRLGATLKRLGLVRPTLAQVGAGVGLGLALAVVASFGLDPGINQLWKAMGWGTTDTEAFAQLLSNVITPFGAVLIGITAGLGEELAVRGLLQPRIGLLASNLVFTSLHAFQYGVDALLSVFIIGLILGIIRMRSNTTTSAIVHGVYDFVLVLASTDIFVGNPGQ